MDIKLSNLLRTRTTAYVYHGGKLRRYWPVSEGYVCEDGTFWPLSGPSNPPASINSAGHALEITNTRQLNTHKVKINGEFLEHLTGIPRYRWQGLSKVEKAQLREVIAKIYPEIDKIFGSFQERLYHEYTEFLQVEIEPNRPTDL